MIGTFLGTLEVNQPKLHFIIFKADSFFSLLCIIFV